MTDNYVNGQWRHLSDHEHQLFNNVNNAIYVTIDSHRIINSEVWPGLPQKYKTENFATIVNNF